MDSGYLGVIGPGDDRKGPLGGFPRLQDVSGSVAFLQRSSGGRVVDRLPSLLINESAPHPPQPPNRRSPASPVPLGCPSPLRQPKTEVLPEPHSRLQAAPSKAVA